MVSKYIPENISNAQKQGFSSPDASWFKGESIDFVKDTLYNQDPLIFEVLDNSNVPALKIKFAFFIINFGYIKRYNHPTVLKLYLVYPKFFHQSFLFFV